jgi:hypothetical protein
VTTRRLRPPNGSRRRREPVAWIAAVYVLALLTWVLFTVMHRVDSALQQMTLGGPAGGALGFPVSLTDAAGSLDPGRAGDAVATTRAAWGRFAADVTQTRTLSDPLEVARQLVCLDLCLIALYTTLVLVLLVALHRLDGAGAGRSTGDLQRRRRGGMLLGAGFALIALVLVDLGEDWELYRALVRGDDLTSALPNVALGPLLTMLKLPLVAAVVVPIVFVGGSLVVASRPLRTALVSVRGVLYGVAALAFFLMRGMGAAQLDDVVRAWDGWRTLWAVLAVAVVGVTVAGVARQLSGSACEYPAPDVGRSAQPVLLGTGFTLMLAGLLLWRLGWGWGLCAGGAVLIGFWALGLLVEGVPPWPDLPVPLPGRGRPALVLFVTWLVGAGLGLVVGVVAGLAGPWLAGFAVGGGLLAHAVLAIWAMLAGDYDPDQAALRSVADGIAATVRAVREQADRAHEERGNARRAANQGDPAAWRAALRAAENHAKRAESGARAARIAYRAWARTAPAEGGGSLPDDRSCRAAVDRAAGMAAAARASATAIAAEGDAGDVALWGDRIGRLAGGAIAVVLVVAIGRATAVDAYIAERPDWDVVGWPMAGAGAIALIGLAVALYRPRWLADRARRSEPWWWCLWFAVALVGGVLMLADSRAVTWAEAAGSVAVVLGGFTVAAGVLAVLAVGARSGPITRYALAPALRTLRLRRFPVLLFLLLWALVVSALDGGGYHDVRRHRAGGLSVTPTLAQAWQQYVGSASGPNARPVVLVAAQGGGIRAAVWTALVMECLFGPGPVAGSGSICAHGAGRPDPARLAATATEPMPVFLASGASGGSVGLAAWSARRADLIQDGAGSTTPKTVEEALNRDFVAPDVARLLLADLPRTLLAWDRADRAEMLERAWERPWHDGGEARDRGLTRGMRATWDVTHGAGAWGTPVLAFNSHSVEDDCRFVTSAVDFALPRLAGADPVAAVQPVTSASDAPNDAACRGVRRSDAGLLDALPSTNELIDYLCPSEDVPMSTAAHLSARFPYVSPTGRIERTGCAPGDVTTGLVPDPAVSYAADGGLFDNAGAGTAVDAWRALLPLAALTERATGTCLVPIFVQIDNSAPAAMVSSVADPRPNELFAPIGATLNQVTSRERYARAGAAAAFGTPVSAGGRTVRGASSLWFRISLYGQPGPEPPTGWTLAPETVDDMRSQLRVASNQQQIQQLRTLLADSGLNCA